MNKPLVERVTPKFKTPGRSIFSSKKEAEATIVGDSGRAIIIMQNGQTKILYFGDEITIKESRDLKVYRVDMSRQTVEIGGDLPTKTHGFDFKTTAHIEVAIDPKQVLAYVTRINEPFKIFAELVRNQARRIARSYEVDEVTKAEIEIENAIRNLDTSSVCLQVHNVLIRIEEDEASQQYIRDKQRLEQEQAISKLRLEHQHTLHEIIADHMRNQQKKDVEHAENIGDYIWIAEILKANPLVVRDFYEGLGDEKRQTLKALLESVETDTLEWDKIRDQIKGYLHTLSSTQVIAENLSTNWQSHINKDLVNFTAFHPKEVVAEEWYTLLVYIHLATMADLILDDSMKFLEEMGGNQRKATSRRQVQLARGTELRIVPVGQGIEFNPGWTGIRWEEDIERVDLRFRVNKKMIDQPTIGNILVYVGPIEIAIIQFVVFATRPEPIKPDIDHKIDQPSNNPLAMAKLHSTTAQMYTKIFVSYSREDAKFAKSYRLAQLAAGHDVFMDTESIRTGENWQSALARAIDNADIFQLFWSANSASSPNVRDEWDYALKFKCPDDLCTGFIRPVYWEQPMPSPPAELEHLNFRYVPLLGEEE